MHRPVMESKVPQVTAGFWIIKIAATTLGETGGDAASMTLNLGYAISSGIFIAIFVVFVAAQISARSFHPFLYWAVIVATTTAGTRIDAAIQSLLAEDVVATGFLSVGVHHGSRCEGRSAPGEGAAQISE